MPKKGLVYYELTTTYYGNPIRLIKVYHLLETKKPYDVDLNY